MPNYTVDVEPSPATIDGARSLTLTLAGTPLPTAYRGRIGGAVLAELMLRRRGLGETLVSFPAGFAFGALSGRGLPSGVSAAIDAEALFDITCLDPTGTDANPWPTITAIAAAITPP